MISVQEFDRWNTWGKNAWRFSSLSTFFNLFCFRTLKIHRETWQTRGKKKSTEVWEKVLVVRRRRELALKVPVESEERGLEGKRERGTKEAWAEKSLAEGGCNYYESRKWVWFTRGEREGKKKKGKKKWGTQRQSFDGKKGLCCFFLNNFVLLFVSLYQHFIQSFRTERDDVIRSSSLFSFLFFSWRWWWCARKFVANSFSLP